MAEKTRYTDEELEEFRQIINEKMALAKRAAEVHPRSESSPGPY